MIEKDKWLSKKIAELTKQGFNKSQSAIIAYNLYSKENDKPKAQEGNWYQANPNPLNNYQGMSPNLNYMYPPNAGITIADPTQENNEGTPPSQETLNRARQNKMYNSQMRYDENTGQYRDNYDDEGNALQQPNYQDYYNNQIYNPYSGVGLEQSLFTLGQGIGEKDPYKIGLGAGASLLKIGRTGLAGVATGRENQRVQAEMFNKLYEDRRRPQMFQQGGLTNADLLTGQYATDNPQGNIEAENGEFLKNNETGEVQKIVGEDHKNGGVGISINDGKILSDYTKIGAKTAKELKDKYQLSLRPTDTFAKAMDKINDKIGVTKTANELAKSIEKLGDNEGVKDSTTKRLNEVSLTKTIEKSQEKLDTLKGAQNYAFEDIFAIQESKGKIGDGKTLLDDKGKPMKENYQQGGAFVGDLAYTMTDEEERRAQAPQMPIKRILYNVGTNEVKEGKLQPGNYVKIEYNNNRIDYLDDSGYENLKRLNNYRIYQESLTNKNKPLPQQPLAVLEEGGHIQELAKKHGISPQRAMELTKYQEGGNVSQEDQMQQIMSSIAQQLQNGTPPEQIAEQLISMGIPEEQVGQMISSVSEQLQGQTPQQEMMAEGGQTGNPPIVNSTTVKDFKKNPSDVSWLPYTPQNEAGNDIWLGVNYATLWKPLVEETMADPAKAKKVEGWLLANKDKFSLNIQAQLEGLTGQDRMDRIKALATDYKPGLFHNAFLEATKVVEPAKVEAVEKQAEVVVKEDPTVRNLTKWTMPNLPVDFVLPPSAMQMVAKEYIPLDRQQPIKQTVEPYLAEAERQGQTSREQLSATGLPPQVQEALLGQQLAASQMGNNDAISKVENFNAQNQFQTDQFNIGQAGKEDILNAQFNQDYQDKMFRTIANQERDTRRYYNELNDQNRFNFDYIAKRNLLNAESQNYKTNGTDIFFQDNKPANLGYTYLTKEQAEKMTPQQLIDYTKAETERVNQANMMNNYRER